MTAALVWLWEPQAMYWDFVIRHIDCTKYVFFFGMVTWGCMCFFVVNLTPCYFSGFVCCVHKLSLSLVTCRYRKRIKKCALTSRVLNLGGIWRWMVSFTPVTLAERDRGRERICCTLWRARWASEFVRMWWQTEEYLCLPVIELGWSN